ncbi:hypothetical protein MGWOODY_Smn2906 [hydrothermal vent metagenome]|uniref:Uncharacterized protein n=1 Tax=hydrothermal vent metagenome TaxID=652676 RepID=A0A160THG4_9ZZZZ
MRNAFQKRACDRHRPCRIGTQHLPCLGNGRFPGRGWRIVDGCGQNRCPEIRYPGQSGTARHRIGSPVYQRATENL